VVRVVDNAGKRRYELWVDDRLAGFTRYKRKGDEVLLLHTEVDPDLRRQGLGSELVEGELDDIRSRGLTVRPLCPFVAAWLRRHPEASDLLAS
jgi:predicted GNAT family acetyltransferase